MPCAARTFTAVSIPWMAVGLAVASIASMSIVSLASAAPSSTRKVRNPAPRPDRARALVRSAQEPSRIDIDAESEDDDENLRLFAREAREPAPRLPLDLEWINSPLLGLQDLRGRVVLIEVWEASCINCLRTLPVLGRLHTRYALSGLTVIGIHSPEFIFTAGRAFVEKAARRLGLRFTVASDTNKSFWKSWQVHGWPTCFLVDSRGMLASMGQGEFTAGLMDRQVRALLREARPAQQLPPEAENPSGPDPRVAECGFVTPEVSTRAGREFLLSPEGYRPSETILYADPGLARREGTLFLRGPWSWLPNGLKRGCGNAPASIGITYTGKEVYAVLANPAATQQQVEIRQDGRPLTTANKGRDVAILGDGRSVIVLNESRLHYLVVNPDTGRHDLELFPSSPFFEIHGFSFSNRCQTDFPHQ